MKRDLKCGNEISNRVRTAAAILGMSLKQFCQRMNIPMPPEETGFDSIELGFTGQYSYPSHAEVSPLGPSIGLHLPDFAGEQMSHSYEDFVLLEGPCPNNALIPRPVTTDQYSDTIPTSRSLFTIQTSLDNFSVPNTLVTRVPEPSAHLPSLQSSSGSNPQSGLTTPSASSWIITTPTSSKGVSPQHTFFETDQELGATSEKVDELTRPAANLGPCSKVWKIPPGQKTRGKQRHRKPTTRKRQRNKGEVHHDGPCRRGGFKTEQLRQQTAITRKHRSCIRCRMLQNRCESNADDPAGVCLNCKNVARPIMCKLPCLRWIITDSSLYREQPMPYQLFSRRWQNMDLVDITDWASNEVKTVVISQIFLDAPYEVEVREFIPVEGDMLEAVWKSGSVVKRQQIPHYALSDMKKTAIMLEQFIDANIATYISGVAYNMDVLFWKTYKFAFQYIGEAKTLQEQELLRNTFRLWVGCRKTSNPHHIYGNDKLGGDVVEDPDSLFYKVVPMPVIMIAQMECIMYTRVLRPLTKLVLRHLNDLVRKNKKRYWLTIYLTMFILLHSCSMLTRRDWETARQYDLREEFANPESIKLHHVGSEMLLAHFHYLNKGVLPFELSHDAKGRQEISKAADLEDYQVDFVWETSTLINDTQRVAMMREVRNRRDVGHDLYWVSQLYDHNWQPISSA
ncbi:hypothetical protein F5X99DRAFT_415506 [Biscogniauxia marginata]|nr:hypothetical protein F5X99DRAFT_415506 [Biscogniauxia marginata]